MRFKGLSYDACPVRRTTLAPISSTFRAGDVHHGVASWCVGLGERSTVADHEGRREEEDLFELHSCDDAPMLVVKIRGETVSG